MEPGKGNCETCKRLIRLCGNLDYFPVDPQIRLLLVERLHRLAGDHQHAKAMIDRWLDTQTAAPKVADLVSLAAQVRTASQGLPAGCPVCNGQPWVEGPDGWGRCSCGRGQALHQMDQRHAALI
jgi:hypothetical protein